MADISKIQTLTGDIYNLKDAESRKNISALIQVLSNILESIDPDAFPIYDTASGEIVSITDGADNIPIKNFIATIEPKQDLNGYEFPWPNGGNINIMPTITPGTYTKSGFTAVVNSNGVIHLTGKNTSNENVTVWFPEFTTAFKLPLNSYVHLRNTGNIYTSAISFGIGGSNPGLNSNNRIFLNTIERTATVENKLFIEASVTSYIDVTL